MPTHRTVTIANTGISFDVRDNETILDAARRNGVALPHGCRTGVCGVCISQIKSGEIHYPDGPPMALFDEDIKQNRGLCCVGTITTDIEIDVINLGKDFEPWE